MTSFEIAGIDYRTPLLSKKHVVDLYPIECRGWIYNFATGRARLRGTPGDICGAVVACRWRFEKSDRRL